jgi:proline iminopeptidase
MWREMEPDDRIEVDVDGFRVVAYSFGSGKETVFCLNGGPGLPCDYLRESHSCLVDQGYRVVAFDQLGTGASDRPTDPALWTIGRYVEETETVRSKLGLGKVHMLGHSWGGWLAIDYALTYQENLQTLILEDTVADMPHLVQELDRLRSALGAETVAMMQKHEAQGTLSHPEYQAAVTILNYRHVCRLEEWPAPVMRSLDDWNMGPYGTMQGSHSHHKWRT